MIAVRVCKSELQLPAKFTFISFTNEFNQISTGRFLKIFLVAEAEGIGFEKMIISR